MSSDAESFVLRLCKERQELTPIQCHVLQLLAIRHNHDLRIAWPSVANMALESHYTERAIFKALDVLTEAGILHRDFGPLPHTRDERARSGNLYRFPGLDTIPANAAPRLKGGRKRDEPRSPEHGSSEPSSSAEMNDEPKRDEPDAHVTPSTYVTRRELQARVRARREIATTTTTTRRTSPLGEVLDAIKALGGVCAPSDRDGAALKHALEVDPDYDLQAVAQAYVAYREWGPSWMADGNQPPIRQVIDNLAAYLDWDRNGRQAMVSSGNGYSNGYGRREPEPEFWDTHESPEVLPEFKPCPHCGAPVTKYDQSHRCPGSDEARKASQAVLSNGLVLAAQSGNHRSEAQIAALPAPTDDDDLPPQF